MMISDETKKTFLREMLRIRRTEERIDAEYLSDRMRTPIHLCTGQEAIAVGACQALRIDDYISSNHRSHGHYLAKGGDLKALMAELHCRETGCSRGFGGSMHLIDVKVGHLGSSSIVGGGIPIGTGHALAFKMRQENRVSLVFFGDGAAEEGVLYESVHFAVTNRLPVIYFLENNGLVVCSSSAKRGSPPPVFRRGYPESELPYYNIDGNKVREVWETVSAAATRARMGLGPSFIEGRTCRLAGHMGCAAQDPGGYRADLGPEFQSTTDPIEDFTAELKNEAVITDDDLAAMEEDVAREIEAAFAFALESSFPDSLSVGGPVYCE